MPSYDIKDRNKEKYEILEKMSFKYGLQQFNIRNVENNIQISHWLKNMRQGIILIGLHD